LIEKPPADPTNHLWFGGSWKSQTSFKKRQWSISDLSEWKSVRKFWTTLKWLISVFTFSYDAASYERKILVESPLLKMMSNNRELEMKQKAQDKEE